jgi:hypothetical protein
MPGSRRYNAHMLSGSGSQTADDYAKQIKNVLPLEGMDNMEGQCELQINPVPQNPLIPAYRCSTQNQISYRLLSFSFLGSALSLVQAVEV